MSGDIYKVVSGRYCIGCGVCTFGRKDIKVEMTGDGRYEACLPHNEDMLSVSQRCPFAAKINEDELARELFDSPGIKRDSAIGRYLKCFAGHVAKGSFREKGSSGGLGSFIAAELMNKKLVDAVIHVRTNEDLSSGHPHFVYSISDTVDVVCRGAKSRYYPVELSGILEQIEADQRRFAFIGLPCFVKALRLIQKQNPEFKRKVPFAIGLVCGHLKTTQFADYYSYELGLRPEKIATIDFRHKVEGNKVGDYGVELSAQDGTVRAKENRSIFGVGWGYGLFKNSACDFCDDVLAETADITIGDAWLPAYKDDWRGTNVVIVRNLDLLKLIEQGIEDKTLELDVLSSKDIVNSQESGLRHRREGLSYRLWLKDMRNVWCPLKRIHADACLNRGFKFRLVHRLRPLLAERSRCEFLKVRGPLSFYFFKVRMMPLIFIYNVANKGLAGSLLMILPKCVKRAIKQIKRMLWR